ncbi:MAG: DHH family phosphoesterase, partial [Gammaproteobacteria bacterium]|nr:DHH family phosphoesterase [Gammaproteobacteria bacterium]
MNPEIQDRVPRPGSDRWDWPESMPPLLRRVFARRDIDGPDQLCHQLSALLPVGQFTVLTDAVELLLTHRRGGIVIVGDFDADGATSAALLLLGLSSLGFDQVSVVIPDRFDMGYGLTPEAVEQAMVHQPSLLVTVDNGITSIDGVELARQRGLDVLITDHHLPGHRLPPANVIVNPNLRGEAFPAPCLAGVGVAFYLLAALARRNQPAVPVARFLDLGALGTMADVVPLDQNNRILVEQGLKRIRAGECRPGIRALFEVSGRSLADARAQDLAFYIAPRVNAAGRLEDMAVGVRCLTTDDLDEARVLATRLDALNSERRNIQSQMQDRADAIVDRLALESNTLPHATCPADEDWHQVVVGLVAS